VLIGAAKVIRVLGPPLLTGLLLLLAATVRLATSLLSLLEPRMGINQRRQKEHLRLPNIPSPPVNLRRRNKQGEQEKKREEAKGKGY
jgi:hypothetical protein